jgi:hypothetical protein
MPTEMLTKPKKRAVPPAPAPVKVERDVAGERQIKRVRRLVANAVAWGVGTTAVTVGWVAHEWNANGAFQRFGHEGNNGDWNPTLWAFIVLIWTLVVGIMALRVYFERPVPTERLERIGRLRFHVAAWLFGMVVLTPLNALIEWQDNGGFERFSTNSKPGSWDPWTLYVGGIWAAGIAVFVGLPLIMIKWKKE